MKLLEAQPEIAPGAPPAPPAERPPEEPAVEPGARTCKSCGATMEPGQDWCLACGTAAGRIGTRPGARSAMTVFALTAVLLAGAVGASYAALREDQTVPPSQSAAAAQVAQAPPATGPPARPPPPPPRSAAGPPPQGAPGDDHAARLDDDHAGAWHDHRQEQHPEGPGAVEQLDGSDPEGDAAGGGPASDDAARHADP